MQFLLFVLLYIVLGLGLIGLMVTLLWHIPAVRTPVNSRFTSQDQVDWYTYIKSVGDRLRKKDCSAIPLAVDLLTDKQVLITNLFGACANLKNPCTIVKSPDNIFGITPCMNVTSNLLHSLLIPPPAYESVKVCDPSNTAYESDKAWNVALEQWNAFEESLLSCTQRVEWVVSAYDTSGTFCEATTQTRVTGKHFATKDSCDQYRLNPSTTPEIADFYSTHYYDVMFVESS